AARRARAPCRGRSRSGSRGPPAASARRRCPAARRRAATARAAAAGAAARPARWRPAASPRASAALLQRTDVRGADAAVQQLLRQATEALVHQRGLVALQRRVGLGGLLPIAARGPG